MIALARPCKFCGQRPACNALGLCRPCYDRPSVKRLYRIARNRPPWWSDHLDRLADRASARVPLFSEEVPACSLAVSPSRRPS
jgi:hypothetical protein